MKNVWIIMKKEFSRFFRDRRMVLTIFLPGILIFAVYSIMGSVISSDLSSVDDGYKPTAVIYNLPDGWEEDFDGLVEFKDFTVEEAKEKIKDGELDVLAVFPENFPQDNDVKIYYNSTEDNSTFAYGLIVSRLDKHNTHAFTVTPLAIFNEKAFASSVLSMLIPLLMFALLASACMAVAPESIAGEKERGTMATMLITPVKRYQIVIGKVLSLSCFAVLSGISSFLGVILSLPKLMVGISVDAISYGAGDYFMLFGIIISLVLAMISLFSVVSTLARTVKEAAAYIGPVMILILILGMCSAFIPNPSPWLCAVPFLGSGLAMAEVMSLSVVPLAIILSILSNLIFVAVMVVAMSFLFKSENVMLKR